MSIRDGIDKMLEECPIDCLPNAIIELIEKEKRAEVIKLLNKIEKIIPAYSVCFSNKYQICISLIKSIRDRYAEPEEPQ